jgi:hypothetical protein
MTYEIICEESFQPKEGRAYQSERVVRTMLTLSEARLECAELNIKAQGNQYYSFRKLVDA